MDLNEGDDGFANFDGSDFEGAESFSSEEDFGSEEEEQYIELLDAHDQDENDKREEKESL